MQVEKHNPTVNKINKTKVEKHPDLHQIQQDRLREIVMEKKQHRIEIQKQKKVEDLKRKQEKEERSYDRIMNTDEMISNAGTLCRLEKRVYDADYCIVICVVLKESFCFIDVQATWCTCSQASYTVKKNIKYDATCTCSVDILLKLQYCI